MTFKFLSAFVLLGFLSACSNKPAEPSQFAVPTEGGYAWQEEVDVSSLQDTEMSKQFKKDTENMVFFAFNRYDVTGQNLEILKAQAEWLKAHPAALILIEGHADERGTREYNLALGERRAASVMDFFIASGINKERIKTISYGKERPMVVGSTEEAWSKNRRAVTIVQ